MADDDAPKTFNLNSPVAPFNVNSGVPESLPDPNQLICRLPSLSEGPIFSADEYASHWTSAVKSAGGVFALVKDMMGTAMPPATQSFGKISYMPNNSTSQLGVLQWPGLPPESLQKLGREMIGQQMIVQQREADVLRFTEKSVKPWRPGWSIKPEDPDEEPDQSTLKEIREAEQFLLNSGFGAVYADPLERDKLMRCSFPQFILKIVRDSLTYDAIAIWTDTDERGRIRSYAPLPAKNVRLLARPDRAKMTEIHEGELNFYGETNAAGKQPDIDPDDPPFAVAVDETNNIVRSFKRSDLIWYTRNPRTEAEVGGYGFPEMEMALVLVTGFNNAIQFNADIFDKNSIPKGILAIKGNFTQRQFDALGRIWDNLQRGNRTDWTLPALQLSEKGEIEVINLEPLRKETSYYNNLINLFMGALATVYCIPVHRLGYKISGTERDSRPDIPKSLQEEDDRGLPALLNHIEFLINDYIIHNRWPHLKFVFTGKTPKEDARLYEVSLLSKTVDERRKLVGDPPYSTLVPRGADEVTKFIAKTMGLAPVDPGLTGIYQSVIAAIVKAGLIGGVPEGQQGGGVGNAGMGDMPGNRFPSKKDPAESEKHGHAAGVRRDSKKEKEAPKLRRQTQTYSTADTQSYSGTGGGAKN